MMLHPLNHGIGEDSGILTVFFIFALSAAAYSQPLQLLMPCLSLMREGRMERGEMRDRQRGEAGSRQTETVSAA